MIIKTTRNLTFRGKVYPIGAQIEVDDMTGGQIVMKRYASLVRETKEKVDEKVTPPSDPVTPPEDKTEEVEVTTEDEKVEVVETKPVKAETHKKKGRPAK